VVHGGISRAMWKMAGCGGGRYILVEKTGKCRVSLAKTFRVCYIKQGCLHMHVKS
jgi:oxalate decarboxylase/phosphoglucose isomerase-like protein (cupin superfamily)